jgi:ABC-type Zn2+ transport system substrate-binding protein/surface adhesin
MSVVKFFTLDDSLMWVLKRVTAHTPKSPHPQAHDAHAHAHAVEALALPSERDHHHHHHTLQHVRSSPTLATVDEEADGAKELYTTNVLAAAASIASPPPAIDGNSVGESGRS